MIDERLALSDRRRSGIDCRHAQSACRRGLELLTLFELPRDFLRALGADCNLSHTLSPRPAFVSGMNELAFSLLPLPAGVGSGPELIGSRAGFDYYFVCRCTRFRCDFTDLTFIHPISRSWPSEAGWLISGNARDGFRYSES